MWDRIHKNEITSKGKLLQKGTLSKNLQVKTNTVFKTQPDGSL